MLPVENDCHNCGPIGIIMGLPRLRDRFPIQFCSFFEEEGLERGQREGGRVEEDEGRVVFSSFSWRRGWSIPGSQSGTGWGGRFEEVWGKKFGKVFIITRGRPEGGGRGGGGGVSEKGRERATGDDNGNLLSTPLPSRPGPGVSGRIHGGSKLRG